MSLIRIAHVFGYYNSLGGVESLLHFHQTQDIRHELDSSIIVLFEPATSHENNVHFLGLETNSSIHCIRQQFAAVIGRLRPQVVIYHMAWGMPFLVDLDGAERRVLVQHGQIPRMADSLSLRAPWLDGVVCIGATVREDVAKFCPAIPLEKLPIIPYPITAEWPVTPRLPSRNRPLVIGFCGRLAFEQKRIDRFPELYRALTTGNLAFELRFIGDGPQAAFLKKQLEHYDNVCFHGRLSGQTYWQALASLDFIIFTSDYEGIPLALLEAMKLGVIPIYPQINSGADDYVKRVDSALLYPPENFTGLPQILRELWEDEAKIDALRAKALAELNPHTGANYMEKFSTFIKQVQCAPRVSHSNPAWRPPLLDYLPQSLVAKIGAVRRGLKRLQKNSR